MAGVDRLCEIGKEVNETGKARVVSRCFMPRDIRRLHGDPRFFLVVPGWMHDSALTEGGRATTRVAIYPEGSRAYRRFSP